MREVFLVRHGSAAAHADGGDPARPLTAEGKAGIAAVARALQAFGVAPDAVWHSPYLRAQETAAILHGVVGGKLVVEPSLTPVASAERAQAAVLGAKERRLVVVSHMPLLPTLLELLVGARLDFGTGTVAHVAVLGGEAGNALLGLWSAEKLALVR